MNQQPGLRSGRLTAAAAFASLGVASTPAQAGDTHAFVKDGQPRTVSTWASPSLMQNPVSICFDWKGNLYVAETDRAGNAVTDTRNIGHLNAIEDDLRLKTVEDRRAQITRWLAKGAFPPDYFTKTEDRVRIVRDTDGDGVADVSGKFAGGFNDAVDGIGSGVLWHNGTLYYTCIPHLWALTPGSDPNVAANRVSLSSGYGVRWCYFGHDLHGLVLGPDGRIYFSMGDRGFNLTTREGKHLYGPDRGGVFRCWPDGSELELYYEGLRNPQELAFDEIGELFTGDNNCDSGDRARVVHIVEGGDSGWRQDVQSLPSRGPWNREGIWQTLAEVSGPARPAWSLPPVGYMCAGPSGLALYPGTGESPAYNGCMFLVDFYGSGAKVHAFRCKPRGAGFEIADHVEYYTGLTITDIAWGYDGRLYMSDWGGGWSPNPNGSVLTVRNDAVHSDPAEHAAITEVGSIFAAGFKHRSQEELLGLLGHRDQRVRQSAQSELASRGAAAANELARCAADGAAPFLKRVHALWCAGQIARKNPDSAAQLVPLLSDSSGEMRAQAAKLLSDLGPRAALGAKLTSLLKDSEARVRLHAAIGLGKIGLTGAERDTAVSALVALLEENNDQDLTIRHGASYALARLAAGPDIARAVQGRSPAARLGAVVALRRLGSPEVAAFLDDADPATVVEAARAVYDLRLHDGMGKLASMLDASIPPDRAIEPFMRRAIEANVFLGGDANVRRLAAFAARPDIAKEWRTLALERLEAWDKPLKREGVWGNWADYPARETASLEHAVKDHIRGVIQATAGTPDLLNKARRLQARHALELSAEQIASQVVDRSLDASYREILLEQLTRRGPALVTGVCTTLLDGGAQGSLRARAEESLAKAAPDTAVARLSESAVYGSGTDRQRAVRLLGTIDTPGARRTVAALVSRLASGELRGSTSLDIYEAGMSLPASDPARHTAEKLGIAAGRPAGFSTDLLIAGGNPEAGRELFLHHGSAECLRCHIIDGNGGTAGPELSHVGSRLTPPELVQSLIEPNAVIAKGYGNVTAMPVMTQFLSAREIRDLVAYLQTCQAPQQEALKAAHAPAAHPESLPDSAPPKWLLGALGLAVLVVAWKSATGSRVAG